MFAKAMIVLGTSLALPVAAYGATLTIIGQSPEARACYLAAEASDVVMPGPEAMATCNRALQVEDLTFEDTVATHVNRGIIEFRQAQFDRAMADFDAALGMAPNQPDALINKGITMLASGGSIESALQMLDAGLAGRPQRPWVGHYGLAVAHELAGRDADAYREYQRAQELKPTWDLPKAALARFSVS